MISWFGMKQVAVALNPTKAKYTASSIACFEVIWLHKLIAKFNNQMLDPIVVHYDNQSCIKVFENSVFHDHSKHIDIWYQFPKDKAHKGVMIIGYVP